MQYVHGTLSEAFARKLKQFWCDGQICECRVDITMSEERTQMREVRLRIDSLLVPRQHPIAHHRVAKIMDSRAYSSASAIRFQA